MAQRRRGLGRGIGALIPETQQESRDRPIDVFFGGPSSRTDSVSSENLAVTGDAVSRETGRLGDRAASHARSDDSGLDGTGVSRETSIRTRVEQDGLFESDGSPKDSESGVVPIAPKSDLDGITDDGARDSQGESLERQPMSEGETAAGLGIASLPDAELTVDREPSIVVPTMGADVSRETSVSGQTDGGWASGEDEGTSDGAADDLVPVPGASYAELPVDSIVPNQRQPRTVFDEDELNELADSIKQVGVLQPVIVRPLSAPIEDLPNARYELIMGERRWRASAVAGNATVPAIVRRTADEDLLRDALLENLHRAQLNPLEEAAAYQQLLEDFGCTQEELAKRIARSRPQISNTLRLLKLPPLVQRRVAAQVLSAGHARALLGLADPAAMERLAQRIVAESLSVRQVEEIVALGSEQSMATGSRRRAKRHVGELNQLSSRLADRFDTKVKVDLGQHKGTIRIDFASISDLNRILEVLAPDENGVEVSEDE